MPTLKKEKDLKLQSNFIFLEKELTKHKTNRSKEIINIKAVINKIENRKTNNQLTEFFFKKKDKQNKQNFS